MKNTLIHGIDFGPIWGMSGVQNFFGEGWKYHKHLHKLGMSFEGMTFVAKTTTLDARDGYMPLDDELQPKEMFPRCIYVDPLRSIALNAVGLSGPGLDTLLAWNDWQSRTEPFFISFMSVAATKEENLHEFKCFVSKIDAKRRFFRSRFGAQLNLSCPNAGGDLEKLAASTTSILDEADPLTDKGIALVTKIGVDMPVEQALAISRHRNCHAICLSNTIPFGKLPERIPWKKLFPKGSPLLRRGLPQPGGLSGKLLHPLVVEWVEKAMKLGMEKPINAGGGILKPKDVDALRDAGASSVSIGSIVMLRPLNVNGVIRRAHELFYPRVG